MVWSSFCRPICTAHHAKKKKRRLACELTYISFVPIAPFKQSLLYCFSFKLFQYFTLETAMESFWIIHLDGSLCIQEIVYLRITWSRKVSKHHRYISGFFTLTSDETRTAVLISKYAKYSFWAQVWVANHYRWPCISMEKLAKISRQM